MNATTKTATSEMSLSELVAEYNQLTGKEIKKFSSRAAGEKQLEAARAGVKPKFPSLSESLAAATSSGSSKKAVAASKDKTKAKAQPKAERPAKTSKEPKQPKPAKEGTTAERRCAGISTSWTNETVRAARSRRDGVSVRGHGKYKSVMAALLALNLPTNKNISFRAKLKADGSAIMEHEGSKFHFTLVPKAAAE